MKPQFSSDQVYNRAPFRIHMEHTFTLSPPENEFHQIHSHNRYNYLCYSSQSDRGRILNPDTICYRARQCELRPRLNAFAMVSHRT